MSALPPSPPLDLDDAVRLHEAGRLAEAIAAYRSILAAGPANAEVVHLLAVATRQAGLPNEALALFRRAAALAPDDALVLSDLGAALRDAGHVGEAVDALTRAVALDPTLVDAECALAATLRILSRPAEARPPAMRAVARAPDSAAAHIVLGVVQRDLGEVQQATASLRTALALEPDHAEASCNLAVVLRDQGAFEEALRWARHAVAVAPNLAEAHRTLAVVFRDLGRSRAAIASARRALALRPDDPEALNDLGSAESEAGRLGPAIATLRRAIAARPGWAPPHINLGHAFRAKKMLEEALVSCRTALSLDPGSSEALVLVLRTQRDLCLWDGLEDLERRLDAGDDAHLAKGTRVAEPPLVNIVRRADPARNHVIARSWGDAIKRRVARGPRLRAPTRRRTDAGRIRLGYCAATFHNHPTAHLVRGMFAHHDRDRFEVFTYSYGVNDSGVHRQRIVGASDHFIDVRTKSYAQAARRVRCDGIDILVDLMGFTGGARLEIFALRPAPVQVAYMGMPGDWGCDFIDYLITDRTVSPADEAHHYSAALAYMPECYFATDRDQPIATTVPDRRDAGLPADGVVFCSFNTNYKIVPPMFDGWMRIVGAVPGSVLWLLRDNPATERNLRQAAAARGIDPARLVFGERLPKDEHLARLGLADLALDTFVCGGHTTTVDALWAGVPVVTLRGRHFASRVAASLLGAVGLPDLVTHDLADYEALAVRLARHPAELRAIRDRLDRNRLVAPLFDTARFTRDLEALYTEMWRRHRAGDPTSLIPAASPRTS